MTRRRDRDERGAVAVVSALTLVLVVMAAAFGVDLGMQRVVRSDMQTLADAVALDAARLLDGRTAGKIRTGSGSQPSLAATVAASVARNEGSALGDVEDVTATLVYLTPGAHGQLLPLRTAGPGSPVVEVPDSELPHAVMVTAEGDVDFAFAPGRGGATRSALADAQPFACFRLGSFAAGLNGGDTVVGTAFESMVGDALGMSLKAVGYRGLLTSYVGIDALAAELGAASADEVAELDSVRVRDLLYASATVLDQQGDSSAAATMRSIAAKADASLLIDLADVLVVGDDAAMQGSINAVDLLGSASLAASSVIANGNNFLDLGVPWSVSHAHSGNMELKVIEAPRQACGAPGAAEASTGQVELTADIEFTLPEKVDLPGGRGQLNVLRVSQQDSDSKIGVIAVDATVAGATGRLSGVTCGSGGSVDDPEEFRVRVDSRLLSSSVSLPFRMQGDLDAAGIVPAGLLSGLGANATATLTVDLVMSAHASSYTPARAGTADTAYRVPPRTYQDAEPSIGSGELAALPAVSLQADVAASKATLVIQTRVGPITTTTRTEVAVGALNLTPIMDAVASSVIGTSVAAVVADLDGALTAVSALLGLRVNGADVLGVPRPNCSIPDLVG